MKEIVLNAMESISSIHIMLFWVGCVLLLFIILLYF
jgi:hypothetical protein